MAEAKKEASKRKSESMRDKVEKASNTKEKPRRIQKTASAVTKPVKAAAKMGKTEYHVIPQKQSGFMGFMTKSRSLTPKYFKDSFQELKLVTWPNRRETWRLMIAVFLFATAFGLVISAVDYGLDKLFKGVFL